MARKDSLNLALVMNLKGSFVDMNDQDIDVKVEKGVVFIDISDKMLFNTGEYKLTSKARSVLAKVAAVMKGQPNIEFLVEGHTDNVPIRGGNLRDNWDLSVLRATSVVRILQESSRLDPRIVTAGGRGEYVPVDPADKARNRRIEVILSPDLRQLYELVKD
jgi:chemotaxis protein MotB